MSWQDIGEVLLRVGFGRNSSRAFSRQDHFDDVHLMRSSPKSSQVPAERYASTAVSAARGRNSSALVAEPALPDIRAPIHPLAQAPRRAPSSGEDVTTPRGESSPKNDGVLTQEDGQSEKSRTAPRSVDEADAPSDNEFDETVLPVEYEESTLEEDKAIRRGSLIGDADADERNIVASIDGSRAIADDIDQMVPPKYDHPPSVLAATVNSVNVLNNAAESLAIRCEVESVLTSMLADIEISHSLSTEFWQQTTVDRLEQEIEIARRALEETCATNNAEAKRRMELGDRFVKELVELSSQLADLERWRGENEEKVHQYEDLRKELETSQTRVKFLEQEISKEATAFREEESTEAAGDDGGEALLSNACANIQQGMASHGIVTNEPTSESIKREENSAKPSPCTATASIGVGATSDVTVTTGPTSQSKEREEDSTKPSPGTADAFTGEDSAPRNAPEDMMYPMQMEEETPSLETVAEPVLMNIFSFLEAQDILSVAELDIIMYSRVDSLFGLGGGGGGNRDGEEATKELVVESDKSVIRAKKDLTAPDSPTIASISSAAARVGQGTLGGLSNVFSQIRSHATIVPVQKQQARRPSIGGDSIVSTETAVKSLTTDAIESASSSAILTSDMASNMAAKLAPSELAVIISLRENLRSKDQKLRKLQKEKENVVAELQSIEAVKDFLVKKLREVERTKMEGEENAVETARQLASDQEVIAFLDERVQDLERSVDRLESANSQANREIEMLQTKALQKVRILEDMLKFERDQLNASEKEWKVTKKLLVKEVKKCRRQILSLEAERDGLEEQNTKLKDALLVRHGGSPVLKGTR